MAVLVHKDSGLEFAIRELSQRFDPKWGNVLVLLGQFPVSLRRPLDDVDADYEVRTDGVSFFFSGIMVSMVSEEGEAVIAITSDTETVLH